MPPSPAACRARTGARAAAVDGARSRFAAPVCSRVGEGFEGRTKCRRPVRRRTERGAVSPRPSRGRAAGVARVSSAVHGPKIACALHGRSAEGTPAHAGLRSPCSRYVEAL
ncbi:flagellar hook-length control protein FliK [Burkholderia pseudomallei]|nr:flagellar hook-length control protein FliK [Burkholderia pseudomallei]